MRLVGWTSQGRVTELVLEHGMHPDVALYRAGWVAEKPLRSECAGSEVVVEFMVRAVTPADTPPSIRRVVHEEPEAGEIPFVHQRVGAYGVVLSDRGLLGTVLSKLTGAPGIWALPGGGLETGEAPEAGLLREVYEETGQQIVPGRRPLDRTGPGRALGGLSRATDHLRRTMRNTQPASRPRPRRVNSACQLGVDWGLAKAALDPNGPAGAEPAPAEPPITGVQATR